MNLQDKSHFQWPLKTNIKGSFPSVKCHCPKRYSKKRGCFSQGQFFYCLLQAGTNPKASASSLNILETYHACDVHSWNDGHYDFHSLKNCSCGQCEDELTCKGEDYHTKNPLSCPSHKQIECYN